MFEKKSSNNHNIILNFSHIIILVFWLFYILYIWQSLIIPFIISLLLSFAILWLSKVYKRVWMHPILAFILSVLTYILIFFYIWKIISSNITELIKLAPSYQTKILAISDNLINYFWIDKEKLNISRTLSKLDLQRIFNYVFSALTSISSSIWTILFYTIFILLESRYFDKKIWLMVSDPEKRHNVLEVLNKIETDIKWYFFIKVIVSFITAIISYFIMLIFWLDFALFWALFIFILNFIPNIWSIIAVLFPSLLSFVQVDFTVYSSFFMVTLLVSVQMVVWNFVEPKMMWNKLNLSPLVIIISLSFWWYLWWIIGMLLSVPLMVIMNIILSKFDQTKPIAVFLSEKWDLQVIWSNEFKDKKKIINDIKKKFKKKNK